MRAQYPSTYFLYGTYAIWTISTAAYAIVQISQGQLGPASLWLAIILSLTLSLVFSIQHFKDGLDAMLTVLPLITALCFYTIASRATLLRGPRLMVRSSVDAIVDLGRWIRANMGEEDLEVTH